MTETPRKTSHPIERAKERFGFDFDVHHLAAFRDLILSHRTAEPDPRCVLLHRQPAKNGRPMRTQWAIWHGAEWVPVVYDETARAIVTFLPRSELRRHKHRLPW